jgi:hypothetical protein
MRKVLGAAAIAIGLSSAVPAAQPQSPTAAPALPAEQPPKTRAVEPETQHGLATPAPRKDPYARLFTSPPSHAEAQLAAVEQLAGQPPNSRRVVCGMTVIHTDPSVDRGMVIPRVDDATARPAVRAITPPVCRE